MELTHPLVIRRLQEGELWRGGWGLDRKLPLESRCHFCTVAILLSSSPEIYTIEIA